MRKLSIGACTTRFKIEQLEAVLQQKKKKLAKLEHIRKVLIEREQVFTSCIHQQVDLLEVLGRLAFSLPEPDDAAYEAKATAAVEALLKDMEVAQLMQAADSIPTSATAAMDHSIPAQAPQQQQQQQQHVQQLAVKPQCFTMVTLRRFLQSAECLQTLRRMGSATVEELAGMIREQTMQLGFAVARYPSKIYLGAAALAAAADEKQRSSMQAANARLHAALDTLGTTNLLLHIVGDKVLQLSTLNLETLQPETPPASFWEDVAAKLELPPPHMAQLHTGFLIYNAKRSQLTQQMQATMGKLQQLLKPLTQQQQELQQHLADKQCSGGSNSSSSSSSSSSQFPLAADDARAGVQPGSPAAAAPDMLECMEDADRLLQQLSRQVWCLREASRCLIFQWCNVLDPLQLSRSVVDAWPFIIQPPPVVEVLVKQQVARQQQEGSAIDDGYS